MGSQRRGGRDSSALRNTALVSGALILVGFAVGFAGGFIGGPSGGPESGEPKTLEQLAAATGCKPKIFNNKGLRQGTCQSGQGNFTILTFTDDTGRRTWLREAKNAGGKPAFLVGTRWIIMGADNAKVVGMLEGFRDELGGEVQARSQS
jgi:hypothetical protein